MNHYTLSTFLLCIFLSSFAPIVSKAKKPIDARKRIKKEIKRKSTPLKQMGEEELKVLQQEALAEKNYTLAIKSLERRKNLATTKPDVLEDLMFELGELQFECGKLDQAVSTFNEFKKRVKGHKKTEDAYYKTCLASFLTTLSSERDQTNTVETIKLANEYLTHPAHFNTYTFEVTELKNKAILKLAETEFMICNFHKKNGNFTAAKKRLAYVEEKLIPDLPELASQVLALNDELEAAQHQKSLKPASQKTTYPEHLSKTTVTAHRNRMKNRF